MFRYFFLFYLQVVRFLVENCLVNKNPCDRRGCTPLADAQRMGHALIVEFLTSSNMDLSPSMGKSKVECRGGGENG